MNKIKYLTGILIILFAFSGLNAAYAIKETNKKQENTEQKDVVLKSRIEYNDIIKKAEEHSYDLKAADFSIMISKQGITEARSEYFPKLNLGATTEYTKNFRDAKDSTVMSIGDSFINPYTRFQTVLGVNMAYNLFDFGLRRNILKMAKEDVEIKKMEEKQRLQDVVLNVTDTYAKILMLIAQESAYEQIEQLQDKNLGYYQRLYDAKVVSSTDLNLAKVNLEQTRKQLSEIKSLKAESVSWLSFYTGEEYDVDNLTAENFVDIEFNPFEERNIENSVVWKLHEKIIKKKGYEVKAAKRVNYPKVTAYSRYYLYGSDYSSYVDNINNIRRSNFSVGGSINMPVFDGFKNSANIKTKKLELEQLLVERDKALAEYITKLAIMRSNLSYLNKQIEDNEIIEKELAQKADSTDRLVANRVASPIEGNNAQIEFLKQNIESVKNETAKEAIVRVIEVLTREYK